MYDRKKYEDENKEKIKEYKKQWRLKNKKRADDSHKKWVSNNKDYYKKYGQENKNKISEYDKEYYSKNKDKRLIQTKVWYDNNKIKRLKQINEYKLKKRYGITAEQKEQMRLNQDGKCAICGNPFKSHKDTCVDHNHDTGKVRELLCHKHNSLLGYSGESIEVLQSAIRYLQKHRSDK